MSAFDRGGVANTSSGHTTAIGGLAVLEVRAPLFVFDEVERRSGSIERRCVLVNRRDVPLELRVDFDFPEHSWLQLYSTPGDLPVLDGRLELAPGDNDVIVAIDTDSFNFPTGPFRGRVTFSVDGIPAADGVEISFESVRDLRPFAGFVAIDIGTSSSTAALYEVERDAADAQPRSPQLGHGGEEIASAVFIRDAQRFVRGADGGAIVGDDAVEVYQRIGTRSPLALQLGTKRLIDRERVAIADARGAGALCDPIDLLHALGRGLREQVQRLDEVRARIERVSVTFPPTWSCRQIARWRKLFRRLGFADEAIDMSLDEASAAALNYVASRLRDRDRLDAMLQDVLDTAEPIEDDGLEGTRSTLELLSFDFGGGTIDLARVRVEIGIFPELVRLRLELLGSDSVDFGGDQVTLAVFRILKHRIAMRLAADEAPRPGRSSADPTTWSRTPLGGVDDAFLLPEQVAGALRDLAATSGLEPDALDRARRLVRQHDLGAGDELDETIAHAVDALIPTRFMETEDEPICPRARANFEWLWRRATELKEGLFDEVRARVPADDFPSFDRLDDFSATVALDACPDRFVRDALRRQSTTGIRITAGEIFRAVRPSLEPALSRARALADGARIDRVVLSGKSSRMPPVGWMFSRPRSGGGLGLPPSKIIFDESCAKSAVSRGACLLHILREALVGYEVDVVDFSARLLEAIFYRRGNGTARVLFEAGAIDDLVYHEETPLSRGFPRYLSIFQGPCAESDGARSADDDTHIGCVDFSLPGEALPAPPTQLPGLDGALPPHRELLSLRERDRERFTMIWSALHDLPGSVRLAWMESTATRGTPQRPVYRYYLSRDQILRVVRDRGASDRRLFELAPAGRAIDDRREDPFSGRH